MGRRDAGLVVGMVAAAVLVVLSVPRKTGHAPGALLQAAPSNTAQRALPLARAQLQELKARPRLKEVSPLRLNRDGAVSGRMQKLAEKGTGKTQSVAAKAKAACDAECEKEGKERMKALRAEIDNDFNGMINFGESSAYVPPVEVCATPCPHLRPHLLHPSPTPRHLLTPRHTSLTPSSTPPDTSPTPSRSSSR